jgi:ferritin-like metal-binding protein YciE
MAAESLRELFVEELRDMYDGEKQLTRAVAKMAKSAGSKDLQAAFTGHLQETEKQVTRLEQVFRILGETVRGKKCETRELQFEEHVESHEKIGCERRLSQEEAP